MNATTAAIMFDQRQMGWKRGGSSDTRAQIFAPAYKGFHASPISANDWRRAKKYPFLPPVTLVNHRIEKPREVFNPYRTNAFNGLSY